MILFQTHLAEVKENQKEKKKKLNVNLKGNLYKQPEVKRLMVYPNGESLERATYVWGDNIEQILMGATLRLGLWAQARYLFNMEGRRVNIANVLYGGHLLNIYFVDVSMLESLFFEFHGKYFMY